MPGRKPEDITTRDAPVPEQDRVLPFDTVTPNRLFVVTADPARQGLSATPSEVSALGELSLEWHLKEGNPTQGDWIGDVPGGCAPTQLMHTQGCMKVQETTILGAAFPQW